MIVGISNLLIWVGLDPLKQLGDEDDESNGGASICRQECVTWEVDLYAQGCGLNSKGSRWFHSHLTWHLASLDLVAVISKFGVYREKWVVHKFLRVYKIESESLCRAANCTNSVLTFAYLASLWMQQVMEKCATQKVETFDHSLEVASAILCLLGYLVLRWYHSPLFYDAMKPSFWQLLDYAHSFIPAFSRISSLWERHILKHHGSQNNLDLNESSSLPQH